jgi:putative tricarboxylic transport membrane protein
VRLNDAVIGAILLVLSLAVLWHVRGFPTIPGQPHGAALFPAVVAAGLAVVSVLLIGAGLRAGGPMISFRAASRGGMAAFATTVAALFFYVVLAERLGFIVCSTAVLCALLLAYGVRRMLIVPIAVIATLVIHAGFYTVLKVPLPWGILKPLAW